MKDITGSTGDEGGRVLSFRKKRKNQRKVDYVCCPITILVQTFWGGLYTGSYITFLRRLTRPEPAAFAVVNICGSRKL